VGTIFGHAAQSDDLGASWLVSSEASELKMGAYSPLTENFIFGAYLDDVAVGKSYNTLTLVDTPLTGGTTSDDIPCIAVDSTGTYVSVGNRRGEFGYSTDGGATWSKSAVSIVSPGTEPTSILWMDMKLAGGVEFFAAGYEIGATARPYVAKTSDGGATWQVFDVASRLSSEYASARLRCCAYSGGKYFFGGDLGSDGLLTWTDDFSAFEAEVVADVYRIGAMADLGA
jgi:hypothetical protein